MTHGLGILVSDSLVLAILQGANRYWGGMRRAYGYSLTALVDTFLPPLKAWEG